MSPSSLRLVRTAFVAVVTFGVVALHGQAPTPAPAPAPQQAAPPEFPRVTLAAGRSTVLTTDFDITRYAINNPAIADATVVEPRQILIDGKSAGTVSLIVWGASPVRVQYSVVVDPGVSSLQRQLQTMFPGEEIQATETPDTVILTGHASSNSVMLSAGAIAAAMAPKTKVVNMLVLPGGGGSQQVMLQVRVAEVNRHAVSELGASLFTGGTGVKNVIASGTTEQFSSPTYTGLQSTYDLNGNLLSSSGQMTISNFVNFFVFSNKYQNIGTLIKALETKGNLRHLAEHLFAYNGQEASFLAGGELPIPVVQAPPRQRLSAVQRVRRQIVVSWPTIAGDVIHLKVKPEVSQLDFGNGISIGGFRIPALTTRKAETEVELRDGQSFAIGGLMNNSVEDTRQSIPGMSSLPIIGRLFKSKSTTKDQTELLVLVTPRLVQP